MPDSAQEMVLASRRVLFETGAGAFKLDELFSVRSQARIRCWLAMEQVAGTTDPHHDTTRLSTCKEANFFLIFW